MGFVKLFTNEFSGVKFPVKNNADAKFFVGAENSMIALRAPFTGRTSYVTGELVRAAGLDVRDVEEQRLGAVNSEAVAWIFGVDRELLGLRREPDRLPEARAVGDLEAILRAPHRDAVRADAVREVRRRQRHRPGQAVQR